MPRFARLTTGDYFDVALDYQERVPPIDSHGLGQIVSLELDDLGCAACAFWPERGASVLEQLASPPISVQLVTPELLLRRVWPIRGNAPVLIEPELRQYEQFRSEGWIGAKIIGAGIIRQLLSACRGFVPWDQFHDPKYLDSLLAPGVSPPSTVRYTRAEA